jgi:hypothetical protein
MLMRFCSENNPHWSSDSKAQGDLRVMVWCGTWNDRIIGPYFLQISYWCNLFGIIGV